MITSWGTKNDHYLVRLVTEYRSMSADVDIIVLSNVQKAVAAGVKVMVVDRQNPWSILRVAGAVRYPWSLGQEYREWKRYMGFPFLHRRILADRLNEYDLFIFSEDDTLITERNLQAFQTVSKVAREDEVPGFLRFEISPGGRRNYPEVHGHFHWDPMSIRKRGQYTLASFTNEHAASYVLTRQQLRRAIDSAGYLVEPHAGKYDMLCTAATDPYVQCGLQKLICISHLDDFLIHHLPNVYVGTQFGADDCEVRRQVGVLLRIGAKGHRRGPLFDTETKAELARYSKNFYEPVLPEVLAAIPEGARSILSIGCGWGATEACLTEKGLQVTAVSLDSVIAGHAQQRGVEVITGNFREAREKLAGRRFDCLLLSNVLHLVPNPVEVLSLFGNLLSPGGVLIAVSPNLARLGAKRLICRRGRIAKHEMYRRTGIQFSSHKTVREWFRAAGMQVQKFMDILEPRPKKYSRFTLGLGDRWIAWEFVSIAKMDQSRLTVWSHQLRSQHEISANSRHKRGVPSK
jgi:2-polyprenyl-3-methyl-5-hydroxy-6-metoxy-1,4-benzoquinol methylase